MFAPCVFLEQPVLCNKSCSWNSQYCAIRVKILIQANNWILWRNSNSILICIIQVRVIRAYHCITMHLCLFNLSEIKIYTLFPTRVKMDVCVCAFVRHSLNKLRSSISNVKHRTYTTINIVFYLVSILWNQAAQLCQLHMICLYT